MLATLLILCAQTPVQHELDMIPFEHLINHKAEAEQLRQDRLALDLLSMAADANLDALEEDASLDHHLAAGFYSLGLQGLVIGMEGEQAAMHSPVLGSLFDSRNGGGPFLGSRDVLNSLKTYMEPAFDSKRGSLKVDTTAGGRVLLAYLQPSQSEWIRRFFALQEETETWTALVETHIYIGDSAWLDANGYEKKATPVVDPEAMNDIVAAMRSSSLEELASPKILTQPGMKGSLSSLTEYSYVESWEEHVVHPGSVTVLDPSIETVEEGLTLDVRVLQIDANHYGVELSYELSELMQPIETKEVLLGGVSRLTASPKFTTTSLESHLVAPSGGGAVYRTTRSSDQREVVLVLQFQRIDNTAEK